MLNDRQIKALGIESWELISTVNGERGKEYYIRCADKFTCQVKYTLKEAKERIVHGKMLRAMLDDYLERLEEWTRFINNWVYRLRDEFKNREDMTGCWIENHTSNMRKEKSWLKSHKAILEEGLNKTWPEIRRILEENK